MSSTTTTTMTAVIQFIGIILFTRELPPDNRLRAIIPAISGHTGHQAATARQAITKDMVRPPKVVEEHAAFIAFSASDYLGSKGWAPSGLETVWGYLFVRLDGEHIRFRSGGRVAIQEQPARSERSQAFADATADDSLGLPSLVPCCQGATLKQAFRPPDFAGAVAMFELPSIKVKGCHAKSTDKSVNPSRIDSRALIDNNGVLVIAATRKGQKKEIWLRGDATVIVAHMPSDVVTGKPTGGGTARHYQAYYDMIDNSKCSEDFKTCAAVPAGSLALCRDESMMRQIATQSAVAQALGVTEPEIPWWAMARTDFECSNSQWP